MRSMIQRVATPVVEPIPLGAVVMDSDGDAWFVIGVLRPNDGWGGVMIELVAN